MQLARALALGSKSALQFHPPLSRRHCFRVLPPTNVNSRQADGTGDHHACPQLSIMLGMVQGPLCLSERYLHVNHLLLPAVRSL
jgi:hypothetical protein